MNVVSNEPTPFLIGLDVLREYGLVIDYHYNRVFLCAILPTGHLALEMMTSNSEKGQRTVSSQALSTRRWSLHSRAQEKGRFHLNHPCVIFVEEEPEHEHKDTSTSEDDLLKLWCMLEDVQAWTRFDKRAKTYHTTSSSGPLLENVIARNTIDDKTGHIMSLEYTKHMPSVLVVSGCRIRPNFGRMELGIFIFTVFLYYATVEWIHVWRQFHIL